MSLNIILNTYITLYLLYLFFCFLFCGEHLFPINTFINMHYCFCNAIDILVLLFRNTKYNNVQRFADLIKVTDDCTQ